MQIRVCRCVGGEVSCQFASASLSRARQLANSAHAFSSATCPGEHMLRCSSHVFCKLVAHSYGNRSMHVCESLTPLLRKVRHYLADFVPLHMQAFDAACRVQQHAASVREHNSIFHILQFVSQGHLHFPGKIVCHGQRCTTHVEQRNELREDGKNTSAKGYNLKSLVMIVKLIFFQSSGQCVHVDFTCNF